MDTRRIFAKARAAAPCLSEGECFFDMLERLRTEQQANAEALGHASHYEISVADVFTFMRSYWPFVALFALAGLILAVAYVVTTKRTYVATSQLLIETNQQPTPTMSNTETLMTMDTPQIESQIALLMSDQIAGKVATILEKRQETKEKKPDIENSTTEKSQVHQPVAVQPDDAGAASPPGEGIFARFYQLLFGGPKPETADEKEVRLHNLMLNIQTNMDVRRVGLSYVLNLSFRADDPKTAAFVANAIGDAYVQDRLDLRAQSARQGGAWLESRIGELRQAMNDAALDVQLFKAKRDYRLVERPPNEPIASSEDDDLKRLGMQMQADTNKADTPSRSTAKTELAIGKSSDVGPKQTTLDELESRAETYKKIYESYLQAYMETVQRQSYPGTSARVITRADPPVRKSTPRTTLSLAAGLVLGAIMGVGLSLAHASFDHTVRSANQVSRRLYIPLLGQVVRSYFLHGVPYAHLVPNPFRAGNRGQPYWSFFVVENKRFPKIARELSATAVALKRAMDTHGARIVGVLGTTTDLNSAAIACNLGLLNAHAGRRTLLVETDTAKPNLKSGLAADSRYGLQDFLEGHVSIADAVVLAPQHPGLSLLLAKGEGNIWTADQISALKSFLDQASEQFDLVLVHLPSVRSANRAVASVDNVVIVAQSGRTVMTELEDIIADLRLAGKQPLGVIQSDLA